MFRGDCRSAENHHRAEQAQRQRDTEKQRSFSSRLGTFAHLLEAALAE